jgi:hypothetical protein
MLLQFIILALNKSYKFYLPKKKHDTKSQWQLHKDATFMNISFIQISLRSIVVLQMFLQ